MHHRDEFRLLSVLLCKNTDLLIIEPLDARVL